MMIAITAIAYNKKTYRVLAYAEQTWPPTAILQVAFYGSFS
jgi:hypothetical protein